MMYSIGLKKIAICKGGFTIIELMVATTVFSVVMLAATYAIIGISRQYQRSMNISRTQAAARILLDGVAESIQYSSGQSYSSTEAGTTSLCYGNKMYLYTLGRKKVDSINSGSTDTLNGVLVDKDVVDENCPVVDIINSSDAAGGRQELLGSNMRLAYFKIDPLGGSTYTISIKIAYGDDDLLCSPSVALGSCEPGAAPMPANADNYFRKDLRCKAGAGSEFCAVSGLTTTVQKRL